MIRNYASVSDDHGDVLKFSHFIGIHGYRTDKIGSTCNINFGKPDNLVFAFRKPGRKKRRKYPYDRFPQNFEEAVHCKKCIQFISYPGAFREINLNNRMASKR